MEPNRLKLQRYALLGVRARLLSWIEEAAELKLAFPSLQSLATVQAGLVAVVEDIDEPRKRERVKKAPPAPPKRPHKRQATNGAPAPRQAPSRAVREQRAITASSKLRSWLAGRDVLNLLAAHPEGLTVEDIAGRLQLSRNGAWHRAMTRIRNGHVRVVDPSEKHHRYMLTSEGQNALDADRVAQVTP